MISVAIKDTAKDLYRLIEEVNTVDEPLLIVNDRGGNGVLLSETSWNAIQETLHLNSFPGLAQSILDGGKERNEDCIPEEKTNL